MSLRIFRGSRMQAWLLPIALVFSLFAFSGSATPTAARRAIITEQVVPVQESSKRQISFHIKRDPLSFPASDFFQVLMHNERVVKIQISRSLAGPIVFPESKRYLSPYTFRSADEDSILFPLG